MRLWFSALFILAPTSLLAAPPVLVNVAPQSVNENQNILVNVSASDPDGDNITLTAQNVPTNANFSDLGGGAGALSFSPNFTQAGQFNITVTATDTNAESATTNLAVTVNNVNRAPLLTIFAIISADLGVFSETTLAANDLDGDLVTFSANNLPGDAVIINNGDSSAVIEFTPVEADLGEHNVGIVADDGNGGISAVSIKIIVGGEPIDEGCSTSGRSNAPWGSLALLSLFGVVMLSVRRSRR